MIQDFLQLTINGLLQGGIYSLISIGLTLIFGVTRIVNFAHGEFLMLAMYATFFLFQFFGIDPYLSLLIVTPLLFVLGLCSERLVIHPILNAPSFMQIFATVGLSIALQNAALFFWTADYRSVKTTYAGMMVPAGEFLISFARLMAFLAAVVISYGVFLYLKKTYTGKAIRAVAQNRTAATLMGINIRQIYFFTFGLGTALVGIAGALLMPIYYVFPTVGGLFVLTAFVVVVLGGLGNMTGAFIGGLVIGLVESYSGFYGATQLKEAVYFVIFILVLLLKPSGFYGIVGAEEMGEK
jgi:branched-chain amino acid transport system permease protein